MKAQKAPARPAIVWSKVTRLSAGHGVEFHHRDAPSLVVAFAVGYEWLHTPGTQVTVQVLAARPEEVDSHDWLRIRREVTGAAEKYFSRQPNPTRNVSLGKVRVHYNG